MDGRTELHMACESGDLLHVKHLVNCGADVNALTSLGESPLFYAAYFGYSDIVLFLKSCGGDLNNQTAYGETPLLWCMRHRIRVI